MGINPGDGEISEDFFSYTLEECMEDAQQGNKDAQEMLDVFKVKENYNGKGKFLTQDCNIYDGDWEDGKPHGRGIMTYADGTTRNGKWVEGGYVSELVIRTRNTRKTLYRHRIDYNEN